MKRLPLYGQVTIGRAMGRRALLSLAVLFLAAAGTAYGGPSAINLLSQSHHVWGEAGECESSPPWLPTGNVLTYDQTSATPLDVAVGQPLSATGYAHSIAGDFAVSAESFYWYSFAWATSEYRFTPVGSSLCARVSGWTENYVPSETVVRYTLSDATLGSVLDDFTAMGAGPGEPLGFDWQKCYAVNPDHEYLLTLSANTTGSDYSRSTGIDADLTCIPVPSALLLGTFGAGLVGWRQRRRRRGV
ncbi:MAG: hypothetical protein GY842_23150 [bacterium]|nr:hypothetical protein [bacterium]